MTGRSTTALLMTLALVLLGACSPEPTAEKPRRGSPTALSGTLLITGSSTMQPLMAEVAKHFQSLHPGVRIEVQSGGSGRGITDARTGKADIGMASRALHDHGQRRRLALAARQLANQRGNDNTHCRTGTLGMT